MFTQGTVKHQ